MPFLSRKGTWVQTYHQPLYNAEVIMDDLGQGCQAVSSARGIAGGERGT